MKSKYPPPIRPTQIERHGKAIRDIDRRCAGLRDRLDHTTDPESAAHLEDQLRTLTRERTTPIEELAGWYRGLPPSERQRHEDFIRRCSLGQLSEELESESIR
jgi:hypothetical protein